MASNCKKCNRNVDSKDCRKRNLEGDKDIDMKDNEPYDSLSEESNTVTMDATDIDDDSFDSVQGVDSEPQISRNKKVSTDNVRSNSMDSDVDRCCDCRCQAAGSSSSRACSPCIHQAISELDILNPKKNIHRSSSGQKSFIDEETLSRHMCTEDIPDPDILIRTSGEYRISNFLLWQMAYTEMFFVDKYWPEITHQDLRVVLQQFHDRQRRFGV